MKPSIVALAFLPFLLIACVAASTSVPEVTVTPEPSPTSTSIPAEATMTPEPSPTTTSIPLETMTPEPSPIAPSIPFETITFTTEDNVTLAGTLFGKGKIAVILAHQGTPGANQRTWQPFARLLAERGYTALTFDFRGVGQSEGRLGYGNLWKDVNAAAKFLRERGYRLIVCAGASMGGTACIYNATRDEYLGLITLGSTMKAGRGSDYLPITDNELAKLTLPKLFIAAENEYFIVVNDTKHMAEFSPDPKTLLLLPGRQHGTELFDTSSGEELTAAILEFLESLQNQIFTTSTPTPAPTPIALESGVEPGSDVTITFIRNAGFLFASARGEKVIIDSLFAGLPEYASSPRYNFS